MRRLGKYEQKLKTYIEEGSDLLDFEEDVNKALAKLTADHDIVEMHFKTGLYDPDENGKVNSWYSMALLYENKKVKHVEELTERLFESNESLSRAFCKKLKELEKAERQMFSEFQSLKEFLNRRVCEFEADISDAKDQIPKLIEKALEKRKAKKRIKKKQEVKND